MKKLLDCIQERKVGGAYDNGFWGFSLDLKKTSIDDGCLDVIEYLIQLRSVLKVSKEAGAKKEVYDLLEREVRYFLYGDVRRLIFDLEKAIIERDRDKAREALRKLKNEFGIA